MLLVANEVFFGGGDRVSGTPGYKKNTPDNNNLLLITGIKTYRFLLW